MCERRVNLLVYSLSLHRHSYIGFILAFASSIHNKQQLFLPIAVSTSGRVYEDCARLFFLHTYREASILAGELPEESEQFRFFRASRLSNLKGSVGLIVPKVSAMRVTIPIDLSTSPFIPLPRFLNSRRVPPLLNQSLVLIPQQST